MLAIEESRISIIVSGALNSTFIAPIPTSSSPKYYLDYRSISLCNFVYKMISKIAFSIKPNLSRCISMVQFRFMEHRKILEAIGVAQKLFHNIKKRSQKAMVLQLDLNKSFDRVHWGFLRCTLM